MPNFQYNKECRILLDWLMSHDNLTVREIYNHLVTMGFDFPYTLASSYAFFISEHHCYLDNSNVHRAIICFQSMIIHQYMEFYNFYPFVDSSGSFGYSSSSAQDFE